MLPPVTVDNVAATLERFQADAELIFRRGLVKGMMHGGDIHFYEVTVSQCLVDLPAVRQQHGMEMLMGNTVLGAMLAPTTTVAHRALTKRRLICS